jgi:hypothetical protein
MSERNVELYRGSVEAFNARDIEAMIAWRRPRTAAVARANGRYVCESHET